MSGPWPGWGPVVSSPTSVPAAGGGSALDGSWRPDQPFLGSDGLKVTLRTSPGLTDPGVLKVPLRLQAPVTDDFQRSHAFQWSTYDTIRLGQRSRPMGMQLLELQFSTVLLDGPAQDATSGVVIWPYAPEPQKIITELRHIAGVGVSGARGKATPFRLTITQEAVWGDDEITSMLAVITSVAPTQKAGSVGTEYLNLTFLEYVEDDITRRQEPAAPAQTKQAVVKPTDSLYSLATKYYQQPSAWTKIAQANGITGAAAGSPAALQAWLKKHSKKQLRIPPAPSGAGK